MLPPRVEPLPDIPLLPLEPEPLPDVPLLPLLPLEPEPLVEPVPPEPEPVVEPDSLPRMPPVVPVVPVLLPLLPPVMPLPEPEPVVPGDPTPPLDWASAAPPSATAKAAAAAMVKVVRMIDLPWWVVSAGNGIRTLHGPCGRAKKRIAGAALPRDANAAAHDVAAAPEEDEARRASRSGNGASAVRFAGAGRREKG